MVSYNVAFLHFLIKKIIAGSIDNDISIASS